MHKLRRVLSGLDSHQAIDLLMSQLRKTKNNYEFPGAGLQDRAGQHGRQRLKPPAATASGTA